MKAGHAADGSRRGKWNTRCSDTVSRGSSTTPPSRVGSHAPTATTTTEAVTARSGSVSDTPEDDGEIRSTGVFGYHRQPPATACRTIAAIARSGSSTPASGWKSTGPVKTMPGQRAPASAAVSSRTASPAARSTPARLSGSRPAPWSTPPVGRISGTPAADSTSRHSSRAWPTRPT